MRRPLGSSIDRRSNGRNRLLRIDFRLISFLLITGCMPWDQPEPMMPMEPLAGSREGPPESTLPASHSDAASFIARAGCTSFVEKVRYQSGPHLRMQCGCDQSLTARASDDPYGRWGAAIHSD